MFCPSTGRSGACPLSAFEVAGGGFGVGEGGFGMGEEGSQP